MKSNTVRDIAIIGVLAGVGLLAAKNLKSNTVKAAIGDAVDIGQASILPMTTTPEQFNETVNKTWDIVGDTLQIDTPTIPKPITDFTKNRLENPANPVKAVADPVADIVIDRAEDLDLKDIQRATTPTNPINVVADLASDLITGNYKWTGFKLPW